MPVASAAFLAASLKPTPNSAVTAGVDHVAWKSKPSYAIVATQNRTIPPDLKRLTYKQAHAATTKIPISRMVLRSQPKEVAKGIMVGVDAVPRGIPQIGLSAMHYGVTSQDRWFRQPRLTTAEGDDLMKAVILSAYGSNENVQIEEVALPEPREGEMLVRIAAAGVNSIDWKIRDGAGERLGLTLPIRLGRELVATVEKLGPGVDDFSVNDLIYGMVSTGGFAEYASVSAADMVRAPVGLDAVRAAALPLAGTTAWQSMFDTAGLVAGQRLLITNGSGGVGSLAVQFAKAIGAHVTAIASGRNEQFVRELGADEFIDYQTQPFDEIARDMDVVFDTVGGDMFHRAFKTLKRGGFMVTIVAFPDDEAERHGVKVVRQYAKADAVCLTAITDLVNAGKVVPHLDTVFPFTAIKQAFDQSEGGHTRGKIVLEMVRDQTLG